MVRRSTRSAQALAMRTLCFSSTQAEEAFVRARHAQLKSRFIMGLCIVTMYILAAIVATYVFAGTNYLDTDDGRKATKYRTFVWYWLLAVCVAGIGVIMSRMFKNLRAEVFEWWVVTWVCILMCFATIQHPWYLAKAAGLDPRVVIAPGDVVDTDHLLLLDTALTGCHFMLPMRWVALVPIEIVSFLCYVVPTVIFGSAYKINVCVMNHFILVILIAVASIGKRDLEVHERAAFMQLAEERTLRCQAENQLHMVSADTAGPNEKPQALNDTSSSAAQSIPETTQTGQIFGGFEHDGGNVQEQLEKIINVGVEEYWLVRHQDLQPKPNVFLASGGFGIITAVLYHGAQVAVKMSKSLSRSGGMDPLQLLDMAQELRIFRRLRHPNIVLFYGAAIDPVSPDMFLILEHVRGSELRVEVDGPCLTNKCCGKRCNWLNDICCALKYLHSHSPPIIHGDIKNSNVMVEHLGRLTRAKLLDFGLSRLLTPNAQRLGGTLRWMAPEVILQEEDAMALSADIFSLGRLVYFIITGVQPLCNVERSAIMARARSGQCSPLHWPVGTLCLEPAKTAVDACSAFVPRKRPSIRELRRSLEGWTDVVDAPSLKAVLATAFPKEKECNLVEELWAVRAAHADSVPRSVAAGQPPADGGGKVTTLLYPELKETPPGTRLHALFATMRTWNITMDGGDCCELHPLVREAENIVEILGSKRCSEVKAPTAWQCPSCMMIDTSEDHDRKSCHICGNQVGMAAQQHESLVADEEGHVPFIIGDDEPLVTFGKGGAAIDRAVDLSAARADAEPRNLLTL